MQLLTAFTENEEIYLFFDLCYKPGTAKKRREGGQRVWRIEVFRRTLITSQCSPVDRAHTDTAQCPAPVGKKLQNNSVTVGIGAVLRLAGSHRV